MSVLNKTSRIDWVDGLKGICAIIVVLQHTLVTIIAMYLLNLMGLFYAEEFGAKTNNGWLMHSTETLGHLPGNILCAPLGGCYTILRVGWMLKYVFLGTMWVVILDLLLAGRKWRAKLFLLAICAYVAWKCVVMSHLVRYVFYQRYLLYW